MKKTKLISIVLAALMIVGMIPFGMFSISAAEIPAMPTEYPDGTVGKTEYFADFGGRTTTTKQTTPTTYSNGTTSGYAVIEDGKWVSYSGTGADNYIWATDSVSPFAVRNTDGASGIMFYLESSDDTKNAQFNISFNANSGITRSGGDSNTGLRFVSGVNSYCGTPNTCTSCDDVEGANAAFTSVINHKGNYVYREGTACTYYTYVDGNWVEHKCGGGDSFYIGAAGDAWYYIPFSSFFYLEDDNSDVHTEDNAFGMSYTDIKERYNGMWNIWNLRIRQNKNTGMVLSFNDIYMVYPEFGVASENASVSDFFTNTVLNIENTNDNWSATTDNSGSVTISGKTGNNTTSDSSKRVWIRSTNGSSTTTRDMTKADGIRFYVDSSSLKSDGTQLLLRLRIKDTEKSSSLTSHVMLNNQNSGTYTLTGGDMQYLLRTAGSTVYIKNDDGEWMPYYANNALKDNQNQHADTVALPAGYTGEVYIPMDSFYANVTGSWNGYALMSWDKAVSYGLADKIDQIAIVQTYSNDTNAANYSVTYSDFQIVYEDVEVTKKGVSVGDDLSMRVFAATAEGATVTGATYTVGDDATAHTAKVAKAEGGYTVVCDGILPQDAGKAINVTLNGAVGSVAVTNKITTSVKQYCLDLIASDESEAAKDVAADLLRYAFAAQMFEAEALGEISPADPIIDNTVTGVIAAYGNTPAAPAKSCQKTESTADGYDITSVAIRLENALALKLDVTVPENGAAKLGFKLGDAEEIKADVADGAAVFAIGAADLNKTITVKLYVNGEAAQTLTYKLADYFADALADEALADSEAALVEALYSYCYSADVYAE